MIRLPRVIFGRQLQHHPELLKSRRKLCLAAALMLV